MKDVLSVLIFIILTQTVSGQHILTYNTVAIFSNCSDKPQLLDDYLRKNLTAYSVDTRYIGFVYHSFTYECNNTTDSLNAALDILLGDRYHTHLAHQEERANYQI